MYEYKGFIDRIVDADTVDAILDLGFGIKMHQRFRIEGFDAPETWRPRNEAERIHGEKATAYAETLLYGIELIFNTTKVPGIYGRYGCKITLPTGSDYAAVMIREGFQKLETYE